MLRPAARAPRRLSLRRPAPAAFNYPGATFRKIGSLQEFVRFDEVASDIGPSRFSADEVHKVVILDVRCVRERAVWAWPRACVWRVPFVCVCAWQQKREQRVCTLVLCE